MSFTKEDLKVGYLVEQRDGRLLLVMPDMRDRLVLANGEEWSSLDNYRSDLTNKGGWQGLDIVRVWSRAKLEAHLCEIAPEYRRLLWKRNERKEMTVAEIEKELGYSIKIVK